MKRIVLVIVVLAAVTISGQAPARAEVCQYGVIYLSVQETIEVPKSGSYSGYYPYGSYTEERCKTGAGGTVLTDQPGDVVAYLNPGFSFGTLQLGIQSRVLPDELWCTATVAINDEKWVEGSFTRDSDADEFWDSAFLVLDSQSGIPDSTGLHLGLNEIKATVNCPSYPVANRSVSMRYTLVESPDGPFPGISINDGAEFTNSRKINVTVSYPLHPIASLNRPLREIALSNDGGFSQGLTSISTYATRTVKWTLRATADERLPKTVYARFRLFTNSTRDPGWQTVVYSDDIILDTVAPQISRSSANRTVTKSGVFTLAEFLSPISKRASRVQIMLNAKDNRSGVRNLQVSNSMSTRNAKSMKYKRKTFLNIENSIKSIFIRVQDGAGNWSKWRKLQIR